ncbi:gliding motility-associated C-terminal domain-containing protein [Vicingaceae bacterium]|nr:gliding motility-associated C-terminal domain-containing protein [Vicingaceae bacterium]
MKNKLTTEEQLLQSKLNEAKFGYQEVDWKQIESVVAKKGFLANYGTFLKAAAAFLVLASAVYFVNTKYDKTTETASEVKLTEKVKTVEIIDEKASTLKDETTTSENIPIKEIITSQVLEEEKVTPLVTPPKEKPKVVQNHITSNEPSVPAKPFLDTVVKNDQAPELDSININVLSKTCINTLVQFEGEYVTSIEEDLKFTWLVNEEAIKGQDSKNSYKFDKAGDYRLTFIISNGQNILGKFSKSIEILSSETVDFEFENINNPFYDQNVRLKAINPQPGSYMWYFNKRNDRVQLGKETAWWFQHPGTYEMNLEFTAPNGCVSTTTKSVVMEEHFTPKIFPNAFSPLQQNGVNDGFILEALRSYTFTNFNLEIVDMNGQKVFKTNDKNEEWNGRLNNNSGNILQGNFAWQVQIENNNGRKKSFQGKVKVTNL